MRAGIDSLNRRGSMFCSGTALVCDGVWQYNPGFTTAGPVPGSDCHWEPAVNSPSCRWIGQRRKTLQQALTSVEKRLAGQKKIPLSIEGWDADFSGSPHIVITPTGQSVTYTHQLRAQPAGSPTDTTGIPLDLIETWATFSHIASPVIPKNP